MCPEGSKIIANIHAIIVVSIQIFISILQILAKPNKIHIIILEIILFTHYDIDGNISTSDPTVSTETPGSNENLRFVNVIYHIDIIQIGNLDYFI